VPLDQTPKLLGVVFDTMYTFTHHIKRQCASARVKVNLLKSLAGIGRGYDRETIIMTYKVIGQSVLKYANTIWSLIIGESNWKQLRAVQNYALKIATGCHKMTHTDHVHTECKMIPIKNHCELITDQFLVSNYRPGHPGNRLSIIPPQNVELNPL